MLKKTQSKYQKMIKSPWVCQVGANRLGHSLVGSVVVVVLVVDVVAEKNTKQISENDKVSIGLSSGRQSHRSLTGRLRGRCSTCGRRC